MKYWNSFSIKYRPALRALAHKNYRYFFIGQGLSFVGTWMQAMATGWLTLKLTNSTFMLGLVGFSGQISAFFLSPIAGVYGDRWNRRTILRVVQSLAMAQSMILALVTWLGIVQIWHILLLNFCLGLINAFEMPTRQSFIIELIEDKLDLSNAIALNSALFNGSRLVGPALAGILIAIAGEELCFFMNSLSFSGSLWALYVIKTRSAENPQKRTKALVDLKEGFAYAMGFIPIRELLFLVSFLSLTGMCFPVLMPFIATNVLHGNSHAYGFLVSSSGAGALIGTLYLAARRSVLGLERTIQLALLFFGLGLVAFSFSRSLPLSMFILLFIGFGMIVGIASSNTILQTIVRDEKRGRVMSFYIMAFMGAAPLGSLFTGILSKATSAPFTILVNGLAAVLFAGFFAYRMPRIRALIHPVYQEKGIIKEVALGIQTATDFRNPPK